MLRCQSIDCLPKPDLKGIHSFHKSVSDHQNTPCHIKETSAWFKRLHPVQVESKKFSTKADGKGPLMGEAIWHPSSVSLTLFLGLASLHSREISHGEGLFSRSGGASRALLKGRCLSVGMQTEVPGQGPCQVEIGFLSKCTHAFLRH